MEQKEVYYDKAKLSRILSMCFDGFFEKIHMFDSVKTNYKKPDEKKISTFLESARSIPRDRFENFIPILGDCESLNKTV